MPSDGFLPTVALRESRCAATFGAVRSLRMRCGVATAGRPSASPLGINEPHRAVVESAPRPFERSDPAPLLAEKTLQN
jgi:hypothetical protein